MVEDVLTTPFKETWTVMVANALASLEVAFLYPLS